MKSDNKSLRRRKLEVPSWELIVLALLLVTVLGVALRGPVNSFPELASNASLTQLERDPYDIRPERSVSGSRNRVETGL
jgi:hypothetical protein